MKLIIAGSRTIELSDRTLDLLVERSGFHPTEIIHGACPSGVDACADRWAKVRGLPVEAVPARWKDFGLSAGPIRNGDMAARADALLLVWDGKSRGSANMKLTAETRGLPIYEVVYSVAEAPIE